MTIAEEIEAAKPRFAADYESAKQHALDLGFTEAEASDIADLWVDVKARYFVLDEKLGEE